MVAGIDTENADVEYIPIKGIQAMLVQKADESQLVWAAKENNIFVSILGREMELEDIIHIANDVQY